MGSGYHDWSDEGWFGHRMLLWVSGLVLAYGSNNGCRMVVDGEDEWCRFSDEGKEARGSGLSGEGKMMKEGSVEVIEKSPGSGEIFCF
ncbi:hypothetical protein V6N12_065433 [Hibiscus sabdariffa]|uniref:Uncharacterized protein n=1 Tax=Hibiscus sabdariffa TaxID=183260 RepID=A0ABR2G8N7_9ROSI